jgi:hypothetical protein
LSRKTEKKKKKMTTDVSFPTFSKLLKEKVSNGLFDGTKPVKQVRPR